MQCVKSAPSTSMTSVQQWLHWVSDVESLPFVSLVGPFSWPLPSPSLHWEQQSEAPKRLCPVVWLPGSSCSENLSQQLPDSLPRRLHQYPHPPGSGHLRVWGGALRARA